MGIHNGVRVTIRDHDLNFTTRRGVAAVPRSEDIPKVMIGKHCDHMTLVPFSGYGTVGDVVDVPRNFGRFCLILSGRAVYPTPENLEWARKFQESGVEILRYSSKTSPATIRFLKGRLYALSKFVN